MDHTLVALFAFLQWDDERLWDRSDSIAMAYAVSNLLYAT
jgi:hypothetical protein